MGTQNIKRLRAKTGAGVLDCQQALQATGNNFDRAVDWLKKKGLAKAGKKVLREARQGVVSSYLHGAGRIGVLVEVNVETDFAAKAEDFKTFVHNLCLHIAASSPLYKDSESVPSEALAREKNILKEQAKGQAQNPEVLNKMVEGRTRKWFAEVCLLDQVFLISQQGGKKPQTVRQALTELIARLGENVVIRRFVRFELGEELHQPQKTS